MKFDRVAQVSRAATADGARQTAPADADHRWHWVDYAKGIAIVLVVVGHVNRGLDAADLADEPSQLVLRSIDVFIYSFHMAIFFFAGGLFAQRLRTRPFSASAANILRSIAYPYFVWSAIQTLLMLAFSRYTNSRVAPHQLWTILIEPPMQFWFLYVYFLLIVSYLVLAKVGVPRLGLTVIFFVSWWLATHEFEIPWLQAALVQICGIYFVLGDLASDPCAAVLNEDSRAPAWVLAAAAVCFLTVYFVSNQVSEPPPTVQLLAAVLGIAGTCSLGHFLASRGLLRSVRWFGIFSLEIYVLHTIVASGVRIGLQKVLGLDNLAIHAALGIAAGVFAPAAVAYCARRYSCEWLFRFPQRVKPAGRSD